MSRLTLQKQVALCLAFSLSNCLNTEKEKVNCCNRTVHVKLEVRLMQCSCCIMLRQQVSTFGLSEEEEGSFFWPIMASCMRILIGRGFAWSVKLGQRLYGDFCEFEGVRAPLVRFPVDPFSAWSTSLRTHPGIAPVKVGASTRVKPPTT